jgi:predicted DNA binding CopG/RHH family protein
MLIAADPAAYCIQNQIAPIGAKGLQMEASSTKTSARSIHIRCPAQLLTAIDRGANKNMMTYSEYVRRSVIERLKADGFDPSQFARVA